MNDRSHIYDYRGDRGDRVYKKAAETNNKSEIWKNSHFFRPGLIDVEGDFIGQLNLRQGPFFATDNM
jgi:hypothetical protein